MLLSQTPDKEIQLHRDERGLLIYETLYDEQVLINGQWWYVDLFSGELLGLVGVN